MAVTLTSTAYSASPKQICAGVNSVSFTYTVGVMSASANATVILGPKIPANSTILLISGSHSTDAATCPVGIGADADLSYFASAQTQGSNAITTKTTLPFLVSVTDTAASLYAVVKFAATPGTNVAAGVFNYSVYFTRDA